jgi:acetyl/propionyl-CoA carboxylase alpha subunit
LERDEHEPDGKGDVMELNYKYNDKVYTVNVVLKEEGYLIDINNKSYQVKAAEHNPGFVQFLVGEESYKTIVSSEGMKRHVFFGGNVFQLEKMEAAGFGQIEEKLTGDVESPISGKVVKVEVKEGQEVGANQLLVIVEAMKMEYRITAPFPSKVLNVNVEQGKQVEIGQLVIKLEDPEGDEKAD